MLINRIGEGYLYNGKTFNVGQKVVSVSGDYRGLSGKILEIRTGEDKETENEDIDIYCQFNPPVHPSDIEDFKNRFPYLDDIGFDFVIMSPYDLKLEEEDPKIKVYLVIEDKAYDGFTENTVEIKSTLEEARVLMNEKLAAAEDIINSLKQDEDFAEDYQETYYEAWYKDCYANNHYSISIEEKEVSISNDIIGKIGHHFVDICRYKDFVSQIEEWDKVAALTEENYQKLIADNEIPQMIEKSLSDYYWESYWDAISDVSHRLVNKYINEQNEESFQCEEDLSKYVDSMLYDSNTSIASMDLYKNGYQVKIDLLVRGEVRVSYKGIEYRNPSDFPQELKDLIKTQPNIWDCNEDVYVSNNNWFEFIYSISCNDELIESDGVILEEDLSKMKPKDVKQKMIEIIGYIIKQIKS